MTVFEVGDSVEGIDDTVKGVVIRVKSDEITIESNEGFVLDFHASELVKMPAYGSIHVTNYEAAQVKKEKELRPTRKSRITKVKERNAPKMEVDLHINQLVKSSKGLSSHEILNIQMETAKRQLEFAIRKRIQKIVFIHGVGEGVLREELYYLFGRYENVKYYDADYQKYGMGATEVYMSQNT
ncbi:MAG: DNA mismatch repair protein MutS [Flavobacteriaceae bacterium]